MAGQSVTVPRQGVRIALIFGGRSEEHEVSIVSARAVARALAAAGHRVLPVAISKEGAWLSESRSAVALASDAKSLSADEERPLAHGLRGALGLLAEVDVAFPLVHGRTGEDGVLQGVLEMIDLPYVGCDVLSSALGMDKWSQKMLLRARGLPTVDFLAVEEHRWRRDEQTVQAEVRASFSYPVFVKPSRGGSSVGINKAYNLEGLTTGLEEAFRLDPVALIEEAVDGREIECSVLGNHEPQASLPGEIIPARDFYDYEAKYSDPATRLLAPVSLPNDQVERVQELAVAAFKAIQGAGMARVDFFLRPNGELCINELNTIPGFTAVSMYPKLWEASGIPFPALVDKLVALALERHAERRGRPTA
jgi:D-alanine-D-alanine ligase